MKKLCLISILLIFVGCAAKQERVVFCVANNSTSTIFVEYILSNDTTNVSILSSMGHIISDFKLPEGQSTNWINDYPAHINIITNFSGDTINFDPNEASNWHLASQSSENYYNLYIGDISF